MLNPYKIMWLTVMFDLPVITKAQRKLAHDFREFLEKDGFNMVQYSVYERFCASREHMEKHIARIRRNLPPEGRVRIQQITDKQYSQTVNFWGKTEEARRKKMEGGNQQLTIF